MDLLNHRAAASTIRKLKSSTTTTWQKYLSGAYSKSINGKLRRLERVNVRQRIRTFVARNDSAEHFMGIRQGI